MSETPLNKDFTKLIKDFYVQSSPMSSHEIQTAKLLIIHLIFFFFFNQMAVSCDFIQMNKRKKKRSYPSSRG